MSPEAPRRRRRLPTTAVDDDEFVEREAPASGSSIYYELSEDYGVVMAATVKWWRTNVSRLEQIVHSSIAFLGSRREVEDDEFVESEAPLAGMPDFCGEYSLHPLPLQLPEE